MRALIELSLCPSSFIDQKEVFEKGLMFVNVIINSQLCKSTLVDLGATHNLSPIKKPVDWN